MINNEETTGKNGRNERTTTTRQREISNKNSLSIQYSYQQSNAATIEKSGKDDPVIAAELAEALNSLSVEERKNALKDIHGIGITSTDQEDPSFLNDQLHLLEETIKNTTDQTLTLPYDLARSMSHDYVNDRVFRLMFLRSEQFDVEKAALKMLNHFKYKLELFGERLLAQDITFNDLDSDDQASVCDGSHQFLGVKDFLGRTIRFVLPELIKFVPWKSVVRAQWYQFMVALDEDKSMQKHGFIQVFLVRQNGIPNLPSGFIENVSQITLKAIPFRISCIHFCFINNRIPSHIRLVVNGFGNKIKARTRIHIEENITTCLYTLQSFGIYQSIVPLRDDGRAETGDFLTQIEKRKKVEIARLEKIAPEKRSKASAIKAKSFSSSIASHKNDESNCSKSVSRDNSENATAAAFATANHYDTDSGTTAAVVEPTTQDVLMGRGMKSPGNFTLACFINNAVEAGYMSMTKFDKTVTALDIVKRIQASGGNFLKPDATSKEWIIADDRMACKTVINRLRNHAERRQRSANMDSSACRNCR